MCTLGVATTSVQVQLALASRNRGETASASLVPIYSLLLSVLRHHHTPRRLSSQSAASSSYGTLWADLMGRHAVVVLLALTVLLLLAAASDGIRLAPADAGANHELVHGSTTAMVVAAQGRRSSRGGGGKADDDLVLREEVVRATGSSLPDCSHACGACSPCSRVMVSFKCSASEPLPCPMVYRCMCRGKCYPVPSS